MLDLVRAIQLEAAYRLFKMRDEVEKMLAESPDALQPFVRVNPDGTVESVMRLGYG